MTAWNGMSLTWDSQNAQKTSTPRPAAVAAISRTIRLLPIPAGPTRATTAPLPSIDRSKIPSIAAISQLPSNHP